MVGTRLREVLFICRREKLRLFERKKLLRARKRGDKQPKITKFKKYKFGEGRKKHIQTMFNTRYEKQHKYMYKSSLNTKFPFEVEVGGRPGNAGSAQFRSMRPQTIKVEKSVLQASVGTLRWFTKTRRIQREIGYKVNVFPDFVLTAKPKEMRMGKGKGGADRKIAPLKAGQPMLDIFLKSPLSPSIFKALVTAVRSKISFQTKNIYNPW